MAERTNPFQSIDWSSDDAAKLGEFLRTPAGRRFIFRLRNERPPIVPPKGETAPSSVDLVAGQAAGFEACITAIFECLTEQPTAAAASMYPDLDDETAWPAELRIQPPTPPEPTK